MKNVIFLACCLFLPRLQAQQSGTLDTTFATKGLSAIDRNTFESILAFAVQPDNKVVAVGFTEESDKSKIAVLRYLADGSLDGSFANNGVFEGTYLPHTNIAQAVTLQPDGKILVAGYGTNTSLPSTFHEDLLILRFNPDGTPDNSFGNNGLKRLNLGYNERPVSIRLTNDGHILVAGNVFHSPLSNFLVYKLNHDGSLDNSFGSNGYKTVNIANNAKNYCSAMELQPDGKILLAGEALSAFGLIRLNPNGDYDTSFGDDGKTTHDLNTGEDGAKAILLLPDGKILLGGYAVTSENKTETALARFNADGSVDNAFGDAGKVLAQMGTDYSTIADLCLTPTGNVIVAGIANRHPTFFDFLLAKYKSNGSLDDGFGVQGITYTDYDGHYDGISDAQILPNGKILVSGTGINKSNSMSEFLLARYWLGESSGTENIEPLVASAWVYPNPTRERKVTLHYDLPEAVEITLELYSINGALLDVLSKRAQVAGKQTELITLPPGLTSGTYLIGLRAGNKQSFVKLIVQ